MYANLTKIFDGEKEPKLLTEVVVLRDIITEYTNVLGIQEAELKARLTIKDKKHSEKVCELYKIYPFYIHPMLITSFNVM